MPFTKTLTFEFLEAAGNPVENEKPAPDVAATKYVKASFWDPAYYRVTFDVTDEQETKEYLNADKTVTVNGIPYKKTSMLSTSRPNEYKVSKDEAYGVVKYLDFTEDGFTEEENEVIIEVDGYGTLTFMVELFDPEAGMEGKSASAAVKVEEEAVETEEGKTEEAKEETVETEEDKTEEAEEDKTEEAEEDKTEEAEEETVETVVDKTEEGKDETVEVEEGKTEEGKDETVETEAGKTEEAKDETVETKEEENGKEAADSKEEEIQEETAETKEKSSDSQEKEPEDEVKIGKTADVTVEE